MYKTERNFENVNKILFEGVGQYGIPQIEAEEFEPCDLISFNYAKSCKNPKEKGVHFFIDDYQFVRLWQQPDKYMGVLGRFKCVLSPDFSTYMDYPKALQIFNHYRKHWIGAYMQAQGIKVIPTISWSDKDSYDWCFDGEPKGGAVAISSVGTQGNKETKNSFLDGYSRMIYKLEPRQIIFYGTVPTECQGNIIKIKPYQERYEVL